MKLLTPLATVVVVLGAAVVHARFIGNYAITAEPRFAWVLVLIGIIWLATYATGVNDPIGTDGSRLLRSAAAVGLAVVIVSVIQLVGGTSLLPRFVLFVTFALLTPALTLVSAIGDRARLRGSAQERVIAVVGPEESERLQREMVRSPEKPARLAAIVNPLELSERKMNDLGTAGRLAEGPDPIQRLVEEHKATLLVLDRQAQSIDDIVSQAARMHSAGVRIRTLSLFYDEWLGRLPISELERIALLFDINEIHHPFYARSKRVLDVSLSVCGLVLLVIAIPIVLVLDRFGNRGPLFFTQQRVGKDGRLFTIVKFRTMAPGNRESEWTRPDDPRLNAIGSFLRRTHLDELPQIWNVLKRDLSLVGPRPEQPRYVQQLSEKIPFYELRHLVRPGITGWAQVKYGYGADELDALEKLQYEFYYLRHQSVALDLRILGRTLRSVASRGGR